MFDFKWGVIGFGIIVVYGYYLFISLKKILFLKKQNLVLGIQEKSRKENVQGWRFILMGISGLGGFSFLRFVLPLERISPFDDIALSAFIGNSILISSIILLLCGLIHLIIFRTE